MARIFIALQNVTPSIKSDSVQSYVVSWSSSSKREKRPFTKQSTALQHTLNNQLIKKKNVSQMRFAFFSTQKKKLSFCTSFGQKITSFCLLRLTNETYFLVAKQCEKIIYFSYRVFHAVFHFGLVNKVSQIEKNSTSSDRHILNLLMLYSRVKHVLFLCLATQ